MPVWRVKIGKQNEGYVVADSGSEALTKAKKLYPTAANDPTLQVIKDSKPIFERFNKDAMVDYLNEAFQVVLPWGRFSREDLLLLCHSVRRLIDKK